MPEMTNLGHIDRVLTNISIAYTQGPGAYIADKVFPIVPVQKQSDIYYVYSKADAFRNEVAARGRGAESAGGNWNVKKADPYYCEKFAYHYDITEEERVNYDAPLNVDRDTTEMLTDKMLLKREMDFAGKFFKAGVWGKDVTGVSGTPSANQVKKWSAADSTPVEDVNALMLDMASKSGRKPNFAIMSPDVLYALKNHEAIKDCIKYTQKGIITVDLIAALFEIENIYIPWGVVNSGPQTPVYDDTLDDIDFIYKGCMLLGYKTNRPSLKEPTAGYIFSWTGLEGASSYGSRIVRLPMPMLGLGTERIEAEMAYDQKIICKDMGMFLKDLI